MKTPMTRRRSLSLFVFPILVLPVLAASGCDTVPDDPKGDPVGADVKPGQSALVLGDVTGPTTGTIYLPPPPPPPPVPPCLSAASCERNFVILTKKVRYFGSYSLDLPNTQVMRAIVDVHGLFRNADVAFNTMVASATFAEVHGFAPGALQNTIIIAPQFPNQEDDRPDDFHHWTDSGWVHGDAAVGSPLSSYAVMDEIVARLNVPGRFPNLKKIIIAGHSAGGQYTHRYAAANFMDGAFSPVPMRYVVANPSSYLYLNRARPHTDGSAGFGVPYGFNCGGGLLSPLCTGFSNAPLCPSSFNDWHYGLEEMPPYPRSMGAETLRQRMVARHVILLLGTLDNDPNHAQLDRSCQGRLQGPHRLARGLNQMAFMNQFFPGHHTALFEVDGAGHDSQAMFVAPPGGVGTGSALLFSGL
jgi:hypothetical protein